jgi:Flp pilus assembly protein TadD
MRSVETWRRAAPLALLSGLLAGCSTVDALRPTPVQPDAASTTATSGSGNGSAGAGAQSAAMKTTATRNATVTTTTAPATDMAVPRASSAPISRAVQASFDDACRALRAGRVDEAERGFRALAQSDPELGGPHANLGLIHLRAERFNEAVAELELAVKGSPEQARYFNSLGIAYRQQGQFAKARGAYEQALALDPGYAAATMNLGILNDLYLRDTSRALELYDQYLALSPAGDPAVSKWVADLKNRQQRVGMLNIREIP